MELELSYETKDFYPIGGFCSVTLALTVTAEAHWNARKEECEVDSLEVFFSDTPLDLKHLTERDRTCIEAYVQSVADSRRDTLEQDWREAQDEAGYERYVDYLADRKAEENES